MIEHCGRKPLDDRTDKKSRYVAWHSLVFGRSGIRVLPLSAQVLPARLGFSDGPSCFHFPHISYGPLELPSLDFPQFLTPNALMSRRQVKVMVHRRTCPDLKICLRPIIPGVSLSSQCAEGASQCEIKQCTRNESRGASSVRNTATHVQVGIGLKVYLSTLAPSLSEEWTTYLISQRAWTLSLSSTQKPRLRSHDELYL